MIYISYLKDNIAYSNDWSIVYSLTSYSYGGVTITGDGLYLDILASLNNEGSSSCHDVGRGCLNDHFH